MSRWTLALGLLCAFGTARAEESPCDAAVRLKRQIAQLEQQLAELRGTPVEEAEPERPSLQACEERVNALEQQLATLSSSEEEATGTGGAGRANGIAPGALEAGAAYRQAHPLRDLREIADHQPLRVEDAWAVRAPVMGYVALLSTAIEPGLTEERDVSLFPQLLIGVTPGVQLGAQAQVGLFREDGTDFGPFSAHVLSELIPETDYVPLVSLKAAALFPHDEVGLGTQLTALGSKTFGQYRVHLNTAYRLQESTENRWSAGVAADRALGDRFLVMADSYYQRFLGQGASAVGADLGAVWDLGGFRLYGAAGVQGVQGDYDPRLLFGVAVQP